jgi:hypothetical protein
MHGSKPRWSPSKKAFASLSIVAAIGAFVSVGVFASWSSTASNTSSLTTGTLSLTNTPTLGTLNLTGLIPGDLLTRCFKIVNDGDLPAAVTLTSTTGGNSSLLSGLTGSIEEGTGTGSTGTGGSCSGFSAGGFLLGTQSIGSDGSAAGAVALSSLAIPGSPQWSSWTASTAKYFQVKVALPPSALAALQGKNATLTLDWVAHQLAGNPNRTS